MPDDPIDYECQSCLDWVRDWSYCFHCEECEICCSCDQEADHG